MNKNILFIWVPKVAGHTIWDCLSENNDDAYNLIENPTEFNGQRIVTFGHISIPDLLSEGILSRDYFNNAFKFAFVRNPWDRFVSLFWHLKRHNSYQVENMSFDDFCYDFYKKEIDPVGLQNMIRLSQANNQVDWLNDEGGGSIVDFIGRFENLEEDLKKLSRKT